MALPIYDWPASLVPVDQLFHVPGAAVEGGMTSSGALALHPEAGGRAVIEWSFHSQRRGFSPQSYSWAASKVSNGTLFRVPVFCGRQTITVAALGMAGAILDSEGVPWDNDQPWSNGQNWAFSPGVLAASSALEGGTSLVVDFGTLPRALTHGHVIGHKDRAYMVDQVEWSGTVAEVTVSPTLRDEVAAGDFITFRPKMIAYCANPDSFRTPMRLRRWVAPVSAIFVEALI